MTQAHGKVGMGMGMCDGYVQLCNETKLTKPQSRLPFHHVYHHQEYQNMCLVCMMNRCPGCCLVSFFLLHSCCTIALLLWALYRLRMSSSMCVLGSSTQYIDPVPVRIVCPARIYCNLPCCCSNSMPPQPSPGVNMPIPAWIQEPTPSGL